MTKCSIIIFHVINEEARAFSRIRRGCDRCRLCCRGSAGGSSKAARISRVVAFFKRKIGGIRNSRVSSLFSGYAFEASVVFFLEMCLEVVKAIMAQIRLW